MGYGLWGLFVAGVELAAERKAAQGKSGGYPPAPPEKCCLNSRPTEEEDRIKEYKEQYP